MTDTKLDADLAAYEERHEKLERFFAAVMALCDESERLTAPCDFSYAPAVKTKDLHKAAKELL